MIAMIIHTIKKKNPRRGNVSTASDPHVPDLPATGMKVHYYMLIEQQQNIILSDYSAQVPFEM